MGVKGFQKGHIVSDETRAKISKANNITPQEVINIIEDVTWQDNGRHNGKIVPAREIAISALEKQIPKKPKRVNKNSVFDGNWKKICPCCGAVLIERITTEDKSYPIQYNMTNHCKCGQTLDWSDS